MPDHDAAHYTSAALSCKRERETAHRAAHQIPTLKSTACAVREAAKTGSRLLRAGLHEFDGGEALRQRATVLDGIESIAHRIAQLREPFLGRRVSLE